MLAWHKAQGNAKEHERAQIVSASQILTKAHEPCYALPSRLVNVIVLIHAFVILRSVYGHGLQIL